MTQTLHLDLRASLNWLLQDSSALASLSETSKLDFAKSLSTGTGTGQADRIWHDRRTLAAGTHEDLDLTALVREVLGQNIVITLGTVKAILLVNLSSITGDDLALGGAGAGAFSAPFDADADARLIVAADSVALLANMQSGWPVVASSADTLRIENNGPNQVDYAIVIAGTST